MRPVFAVALSVFMATATGGAPSDCPLPTNTLLCDGVPVVNHRDAPCLQSVDGVGGRRYRLCAPVGGRLLAAWADDTPITPGRWFSVHAAATLRGSWMRTSLHTTGVTRGVVTEPFMVPLTAAVAAVGAKEGVALPLVMALVVGDTPAARTAAQDALHSVVDAVLLEGGDGARSVGLQLWEFQNGDVLESNADTVVQPGCWLTDGAAHDTGSHGGCKLSFNEAVYRGLADAAGGTSSGVWGSSTTAGSPVSSVVVAAVAVPSQKEAAGAVAGALRRVLHWVDHVHAGRAGTPFLQAVAPVMDPQLAHDLAGGRLSPHTAALAKFAADVGAVLWGGSWPPPSPQPQRASFTHCAPSGCHGLPVTKLYTFQHLLPGRVAVAGHHVPFRQVFAAGLLPKLNLIHTNNPRVRAHIESLLARLQAGEPVSDVDTFLVDSTVGQTLSYLALYTPSDAVWLRTKLPLAAVLNAYVLPESAWRQEFPTCSTVVQVGRVLGGEVSAWLAKGAAFDVAPDGACHGDDHRCRVANMTLDVVSLPLDFTLLGASSSGPFVVWDGNHRAVTVAAHMSRTGVTMVCGGPGTHGANNSALGCPFVHVPPGEACAGGVLHPGCLVDVSVGVSASARRHVVDNELMCPDPPTN